MSIAIAGAGEKVHEHGMDSKQHLGPCNHTSALLACPNPRTTSLMFRQNTHFRLACINTMEPCCQQAPAAIILTSMAYPSTWNSLHTSIQMTAHKMTVDAVLLTWYLLARQIERMRKTLSMSLSQCHCLDLVVTQIQKHLKWSALLAGFVRDLSIGYQTAQPHFPESAALLPSCVSSCAHYAAAADGSGRQPCTRGGAIAEGGQAIQLAV